MTSLSMYRRECIFGIWFSCLFSHHIFLYLVFLEYIERRDLNFLTASLSRPVTLARGLFARVPESGFRKSSRLPKSISLNCFLGEVKNKILEKTEGTWILFAHTLP